MLLDVAILIDCFIFVNTTQTIICFIEKLKEYRIEDNTLAKKE